jgi:hypothetical protein
VWAGCQVFLHCISSSYTWLSHLLTSVRLCLLGSLKASQLFTRFGLFPQLHCDLRELVQSCLQIFRDFGGNHIRIG